MNIVKRRQLKIIGMSDSRCEGRIEVALMQLPGVIGADADHLTGRLLVEYDLLKVNHTDIELAIQQLGHALSGGFLARLKRDFIHTTEENEKSNFLSSGLCCSKKAEQIVNTRRHTARN